MSDARQEHWNAVFTTKAEDAVSWFQATPGTSLCLIRACSLPKDASILDVEAGASHLPDALLEEGFTRSNEVYRETGLGNNGLSGSHP